MARNTRTFFRSRERLVYIITSLLVVGLLHSLLCEWEWKTVRRTSIVAFDHGSGQVPVQSRGSTGPARTVARPVATGLFAQGKSQDMSVIFGVVAPVAILGLMSAVVLRWRREDRRRYGLCEACGHQLQPEQAITRGESRCPECGCVQL